MFRRFESSASSSAAGFLAHTSMRRGILSILQTNSEAVTGFLRVVPSLRGGGCSWFSRVFRVFGGCSWFFGCSGMFRCSGVPCSRVLTILQAAFKSSIYIFLYGSIDICVSSIYMCAVRSIFVRFDLFFAV